MNTLPKKIGIYTDVHSCYTSSILPIHCKGSKYTTRLQMIVDTFKWMYPLFDEHNVELIVSCGDLFDSHSLRVEEATAISEALRHSKGTPEIHVLGNHEMFDKLRNFYVTSVLSNYPHIEVISTPTKFENGLSFLPYMEVDEVITSLPMISNTILFSHVDIKGSKVTATYELEHGVEIADLSKQFKCVLNGHIHNHQRWGNIQNIGAATSLSFADNNDHTPWVAILDTDTFKVEYFQNPHAIRFYNLRLNSIKMVEHYLEKIQNPSVIKLTVPFDIKADVESILKESEQVITFRLHSDKVNQTIDLDELLETVELSTSQDVYTKFVDFLKQQPELKFPLNNYIQIIEELQGVTA